MQHTYLKPLSDEELLSHLVAGDHLIFRVPGLRWQEVERQVERLGFGERFLVGETESSRGRCCRVKPVNGSETERADRLKPLEDGRVG